MQTKPPTRTIKKDIRQDVFFFWCMKESKGRRRRSRGKKVSVGDSLAFQAQTVLKK